MIQLKLKLNSKKPTTVYAVNGKSFLLNPGSNILNLEYEDYLSLAKALGIKPVDNKKNENSAQEKEDKKSKVEDTKVEEPTEPADEKEQEPDAKEVVESEKERESEPVEDIANSENVKESEERADSENNVEDKLEEQTSELIDYSTWTIKQLKAEYKKITGKNCKLKKDEVISFLQEHQSNA